jgi:hypothetical protein
MIFAEIDPKTDEVIQLIVADADFIASGRAGDTSRWRKCSDGSGVDSRMDYPGIGHKLERQTGRYRPPRPVTAGTQWDWDEQKRKWMPDRPQPKAPWEKPDTPPRGRP